MKTMILENKTNNSDNLSKKEIVIIDEEKYNKIIEELENLCKEHRNILYQVEVALDNREVIILSRKNK